MRDPATSILITKRKNTIRVDKEEEGSGLFWPVYRILITLYPCFTQRGRLEGGILVVCGFGPRIMLKWEVLKKRKKKKKKD